MLSKATTLTMLFVATLNLFSVNASEHASACNDSSDEAAFVVSAHVVSDAISKETIPCSDNCQHEDGYHQCHLGHCHYLVTSTLNNLPPQNQKISQAFFNAYWPNPALLSLDKPPRA